MKAFLLALIALFTVVVSPVLAQSVVHDSDDAQTVSAASAFEKDVLGVDGTDIASARWSSCTCNSGTTTCQISCPTGQGANCVRNPYCSCYCK